MKPVIIIAIAFREKNGLGITKYQRLNEEFKKNN